MKMSENGASGFDIVGDIHGHGDELIALLGELGYAHDGDCYRHPSRQVLFLGDFVDRGPKQKLVLDTVMAMHRGGAALAIMGNHEFNALAFHTRHPDDPGRWLRPRNDKNLRQHRAFLDAYLESPNALRNVLDWFWELPLWLELPGRLRAVHACWYPAAIERLKSCLCESNTLTPELLVEASDPASPVFDDVEALLKGREITLPGGIAFKDKDGIERREIRIRWWRDNPQTYADLAQPPLRGSAQSWPCIGATSYGDRHGLFGTGATGVLWPLLVRG